MARARAPPYARHMTELAPLAAPPAAAALVEALAAGDFERLQGLLAVDVRLRALVPRGLVELTGADAVAAQFRRWFGDASAIVPLDCQLGLVGDRSVIGYRLEVQEDARYVVEQQAFADVVDGRIAALDLVCSGFRPLEPAWTR
jgi:hypothetical protein